MTPIAGMDFGFPVVAHPTRPGTAYLLPLESDEYRCTPDGHCTVWRTTDAGVTWEPLTDGLPQQRRPPHGAARRLHDRRRTTRPASTSAPAPARSTARSTTATRGSCLADHLPPVLSVRAAAVG